LSLNKKDVKISHFTYLKKKMKKVKKLFFSNGKRLFIVTICFETTVKISQNFISLIFVLELEIRRKMGAWQKY